MSDIKINTIVSLKEYLFSCGILESGTKEEIAEAKKEYRKAYLLRKMQEYRAKNKIVQLSFPHDYAEYLEGKASEYNMLLPAFIKSCLNGYLEQVFILPCDKNIKCLETELNRIGNNINQIVRHCHRLSLDPTDALSEIHGLLENIDKQISWHLRYPSNLENMIISTLQQQPLFINQLQKILDHYSHAPENDPTPRQEHQKLTTLHD